MPNVNLVSEANLEKLRKKENANKIKEVVLFHLKQRIQYMFVMRLCFAVARAQPLELMVWQSSVVVSALPTTLFFWYLFDQSCSFELFFIFCVLFVQVVKSLKRRFSQLSYILPDVFLLVRPIYLFFSFFFYLCLQPMPCGMRMTYFGSWGVTG